MADEKLSLDTFAKWLESLTEMDRSNFITLINLPNALEVITNMKESSGNNKYTNMAILGLAIKKSEESKDA